MKKSLFSRQQKRAAVITQILRTMKLTFIAVLLICMQLTAKVYPQKNVKLSFDVKEIKLVKALEKIETASDFRFFYNSKEIPLDKYVPLITQGSKSIPEILDRILAPLNLNYQILSGNVIALTTSKNIQFLLVKGVVRDSNGQPLPGVSIKVKGTNKGAVSDVNGRFQIDAAENSVLVITYIGFLSQEISVNNRTDLELVLTEDSQVMSEVVVVGYGTQKKTSVTSAVSTLRGDAITQNPVANINNSIAGRVSGVLAFQSTGEPGADASTIRVRGVGTTGSRNGALSVVDGVPRSFSDLNPNEIESITVLKDAAAIAPYGLAGANGVILVTTKRGKEGKVSLGFSSWYGVQQPTQYPDYLNAFEFASTLNVANANAGLPAAYTPEQLQKYQDGSDPDRFPDVDWMKEVIDFSAPMTSSNLTFSGGSDKVRFFSSLGYLYQQGSVDVINFSRYNLATNVDINATKSTIISLDLKGRLVVTKNPGSQTGTGIYTSVTKNPPLLATPLQFSNGLPGNTLLPSIYESGYARENDNVLYSQLSVEQRIPAIPGLAFKAVAAFDKSMGFDKQWQTPYSIYALNAQDQFIETKAGIVAPSLSQEYSESTNITLQGYVTYRKNFGKHGINALAVAEQRSGFGSSFFASRLNYQVTLDELSLGSSSKTDLDNGGSSNNNKQIGLVYRLGYDFSQKYLAEFSGRYDGHYFFAPGKRFAFFPAVSLGWRLSEESFIKDNFSWIENLKLRGSYGISGNLAGSPFQYLSSYGLNSSYGFGGTQFSQVQGVFERAEPNTNITWETAKKFDVGLEGMFFNGKLGFEIDFFKERRSDMLISPNAVVPVEYGIGISQINAGIMDNRGLDLSLTSSNRFGNGLTLDGGFNFTYAKNELIQTYENASTFDNPNRRLTGRPLDTQFGLRALGLFQSQEEINASPTQFGTLKPGDIKYEDVNADGKIDANDQVVIGDPAFPQMIFGLTGNMSFKGFDLGMLWQGASKSSFQLTNEASNPFFNGAKIFREQLDYWTPDNRDAQYPIIMPSPNTNSSQVSSFWQRDGTYVRLKNIELGYTIPQSIMSKLKISSLRFYSSGQNLLTFSAEKFLDPEIGVSSASKRARYYFQQKVFTFGLNANF